MQNLDAALQQKASRTPRNRGKLLGAKPTLRTRDLAMFNLAIDSKLRGCDVVSLMRIADVGASSWLFKRSNARS